MRKSSSANMLLDHPEVAALAAEVALLERKLRDIVRGVTAKQAEAFNAEQTRLYAECCCAFGPRASNG